MSFHLSISDNVRAWKNWHDRKHTGAWAACMYEPCDQTETEFRKVWGNN